MPDLRVIELEKSQRGKRAVSYWLVGGVLVLFVLGFTGFNTASYQEALRQKDLSERMETYSQVNKVKQQTTVSTTG